MKTYSVWIGALALSAGVCLADVEHRDTIQRSFPRPGAGKLVIDNINGSIKVSTHSGSDVRVTAREHWTADTPEDLEKGRREVRLDISQAGSDVRLYVDGPFRCRENCGGFHGYQGYRVRYDFDVSVPRDTALTLKTVNQGDISVEGTRGAFEVRNVNGGIGMKNVAGSGSVHTVNGRVTVDLAENPSSPLSFKTINGEVTVSFLPGLSADLRIKTFHGEIYTDFETTGLPGGSLEVERKSGRSVYRTNRFTGVRVGAGGPEHRFETLNGTIRILKKGS